MTIKYTDIQPVEDLLDGVRQVVAGHAASVYEPSMVGKTLSMESLSIGDEETMSQISASLQNGLQDTVKAYFPENDAVPSGFTTQTRTVAMECANIGAILASNLLLPWPLPRRWQTSPTSKVSPSVALLAKVTTTPPTR